MADTVRCAPPLPTLPMLPRVRLIDQFRQRFEVRVLTVLAGAGFGKTTALARAVAENRLEPLGADVWLSCTSADNDLSVLAWGLGTALGVETASADTRPAVTAVLAGAVARRRLEQVVFVLDDVHLLRAGSPGAELLADLVVALPTNAHFVFAGRRPVPFPLARLAAAGQVRTVGEEELRFTAEEVAEFAALRGVEPDQLSELGGWPALAELAAQGRGCGVAGTDYLWQELLAGMPAARRRGLAVLSAIGPADADLLARADPVLPPLASVVAEVPMVIHSDGGTTRLHGLWGQALEGVLPAEDVRAARVRAAQAWESRGKVQQAARLLIAAQAFDELVGLCGRVTAPMVPLVPADVLRGWLQALPESLADRPEATLARAVVAEMAHDPSCLALLTDAARRFEAAGDEGGELACHVHRLQQAYWLADVPTLRSVAARLAKLAARGNRFAGIVEVGADATVADCTGDPHSRSRS